MLLSFALFVAVCVCCRGRLTAPTCLLILLFFDLGLLLFLGGLLSLALAISFGFAQDFSSELLLTPLGLLTLRLHLLDFSRLFGFQSFKSFQIFALIVHLLPQLVCALLVDGFDKAILHVEIALRQG